MCGIICEICYQGDYTSKDEKILNRIKNRGPDCVRSLEINVAGVNIYFCGAVLWMQGTEITPQPVENESGVLLYNGDIFDYSWDDNLSDTQIIMEKLSNLKVKSREQHIINELKSLNGPFCIIYYDKINQRLYFTRDKIGRNSLLFHQSENSILLSNVIGRQYDCVEVPATHICILDLKSRKIQLNSWTNNLLDEEECSSTDLFKSFKKQQNLSDEEFSIDHESDQDLEEKNELIDYMRSVAKNNICKRTLMKKLLEHSEIAATVEKITDLLKQSVEIRLNRQPNKCKECLINKTDNCSHCTVGILFSGGLDCTILAFLADKYISSDQSIDLINVAFKRDAKASYDVPDRITGRQSFEELKALCPSRNWVFKEVNVTKEELEDFQIRIIGDLLYPRRTILDESLGSAFWFASRGQDINGVSPCRVLLLGSGADELFGGYKRHYNSFKRHSWTGLSKELLLDWRRISFRNLARDNRVICDHGRQPRMPYLDEDFSNYVLQLKPWIKCFPSEELGPGVGDKLALRLIAFNLGLKDVVTFPKRALQFGSRIANKKEKGSDLSKTFLNTCHM